MKRGCNRSGQASEGEEEEGEEEEEGGERQHSESCGAVLPGLLTHVPGLRV